MSFLLSIISSRIFPYIAMAFLAGGGVWFIYHQGVVAERQRQEITSLQEQAKFMREDADRKRKAAEVDAAKAEEDAKTITDLDAKTKELISAIQDPSNQCFTPDDVDRLRHIWD